MSKSPLPSPSLEGARQLLDIRNIKHVEARQHVIGKRKRSKPKFPINLPADELAATILLGAALGTIPDLIARLLVGQPVVVVIETVDEEMSAALGKSAKACFRIALPTTPVEDGVPFEPAPDVRSAYVCWADPRSRSTDESAKATAAIASMRSVIGLAPNPERELLADLLRTCDHRIVVGRFDAGLLSLLVEAVVGSPPLRKIYPDALKLMRFQDIRLALHPDRTADGCIERLETVARLSRPCPQK